MSGVRFVILQHMDIDPITGTRHVQLYKFDVVRIEEDEELVMNDGPLHIRAAERLKRRLYASLDAAQNVERW
jgi:hypothetical protein